MGDDRQKVVPITPRMVLSSMRSTNDTTGVDNRGERLKGGGPGDTSGGMTDDWKADVNRQLQQLHTDVRSLLNRGVTAVVALALMIGGLYLYTNQKFDAVSQRLAAIEVQQATISGKLDLLLDRKETKRD